MKLHRVNFTSWEDLLRRAALETRPGEASRSTGYGKHWSGTQTFQEALDLARLGWPEGLARMSAKLDLVNRLMPTHNFVKETVLHKSRGSLLMSRHLQGYRRDHLNSVKREIIDTHGKVIVVNMNVSTSAVISTETMFNRGALVCALVDTLERFGLRCEIVASECFVDMGHFVGRNEQVLHYTTVKRAENPLDLERVAFMAAHPAFLRRLMFSITEQLPEDLWHIFRGNYGYPYTWEEPDAINIPAASSADFKSEKDILAWVKERIKEAGIEIQEFEELEPTPYEEMDRSRIPIWAAPFESLSVDLGDESSDDDEDLIDLLLEDEENDEIYDEDEEADEEILTAGGDIPVPLPGEDLPGEEGEDDEDISDQDADGDEDEEDAEDSDEDDLGSEGDSDGDDESEEEDEEGDEDHEDDGFESEDNDEDTHKPQLEHMGLREYWLNWLREGGL